MVKTVAFEAGDRERSHDWVRIGGRSLREGARAGGGSSVADLAGEGGKGLFSRGERPGDPKAALRRCPSSGADLSITSSSSGRRGRFETRLATCSTTVDGIFESSVGVNRLRPGSIRMARASPRATSFGRRGPRLVRSPAPGSPARAGSATGSCEPMRCREAECP